MKAWFLNLGPSSTTNREANSDIEAILSTNPHLVSGCEAINKGDLPKAPKGYSKIRDTSRPGRANLFAYVAGDRLANWEWIDCVKTFPRENGDGQHWPRSILKFSWQQQQIVVAHKPPLWRGAGPARWEHDQKLAVVLNPKSNPQRSRLLLWDCNGLSGAEALAERTNGKVVGKHIDCANIRRIRVMNSDYRTHLNGHKFATDHPWGAFFLQFDWMN